jgi:hypothetical protein
MTFARRVFVGAGIYGVLVLLPQYFLEARLNHDFPPAITHPEQFYGFIGVALAWQLVFLLVACDVSRYRPIMLLAVPEKLAFGVPAVVLFLQHRAPGAVLAVGIVDLALGLLFVAAYRATATQAREGHARAPAHV